MNRCGELVRTLELLRAEAGSHKRLGGSRTSSVPRIHHLKCKPKERTEGKVILSINIEENRKETPGLCNNFNDLFLLAE